MAGKQAKCDMERPCSRCVSRREACMPASTPSKILEAAGSSSVMAKVTASPLGSGAAVQRSEGFLTRMMRSEAAVSGGVHAHASAMSAHDAAMQQGSPTTELPRGHWQLQLAAAGNVGSASSIDDTNSPTVPVTITNEVASDSNGRGTATSCNYRGRDGFSAASDPVNMYARVKNGEVITSKSEKETASEALKGVATTNAKRKYSKKRKRTQDKAIYDALIYNISASAPV